jgi:rod shape-determining protein MreC
MTKETFKFKQKTGLGLLTLFLSFVSAVCIYLNHHDINFQTIRSPLSRLSLFIQYTADFPIKFVYRVIDVWSTKEKLLEENAMLRARLFLLQARLQKQYVVEEKNAELKALLKSNEAVHNKSRVLISELLAVATDRLDKQIILNKGEKAGVFVGQPVLDAFGVVGQVVQVDSLTSRILLLSDRQSAIPVQIKRNGIRAIATGYGVTNRLKLKNMTNTSDVKVGDELIASGLGERYPFGYPVGTIESINRNTGNLFADISVTVAAHLDRSRLFLLIWYSNDRENRMKNVKTLLKRRWGVYVQQENFQRGTTSRVPRTYTGYVGKGHDRDKKVEKLTTKSIGAVS